MHKGPDQETQPNQGSHWKNHSQFQFMDDSPWSDYQSFGVSDRGAMTIYTVFRTLPNLILESR